MHVRTGTSGFAYKEWKGSFYPEDLPQAQMLRYYASRLSAVEINNTFYRMPTEKLLSGWAGEVPETFSFVLKAPQKITHFKRLRGVGDEIDHLLRTASVLGERLGPMLFQLPPNLKKDVPLLREFLATLPQGWRAAFEFRHASWLDDDEVLDALRATGAALVASDMDDEPEPPVVATTSWGYFRLRRAAYERETLERWASLVLRQPWTEAWIFFKHEDAGAGPTLATRFAELAAAGS